MDKSIYYVNLQFVNMWIQSKNNIVYSFIVYNLNFTYVQVVEVDGVLYWHSLLEWLLVFYRHVSSLHPQKMYRTFSGGCRVVLPFLEILIIIRNWSQRLVYACWILYFVFQMKLLKNCYESLFIWNHPVKD